MLNNPIRRGAYASFNARWAGLVQIHQELGRRLAERDRDSGRSTTFAAAKHIAAVACALGRAAADRASARAIDRKAWSRRSLGARVRELYARIWQEWL